MLSLNLYNMEKGKVLTKLAELAFKGELTDQFPQEIGKILYPNRQVAQTHHCCVYKEREISREFANLGMGKKPDGSEPNGKQLVYVCEAACDGCDIHKVRITDSCRLCLARNCQRVCRFDAVYMGENKMHINYEKCKGCGMCAKACSYSAIIQSERPCRKSCPTGALKHIDNEIAYIEESECINCGQCQANCPFGAISEVSCMTKVISQILSDDKVIALVAPAIQGQIEGAKLPQIFDAIRALGFDEVYEVSLGADLTTIHEAEEAKEKLKNGGALTTSCCPAFLQLIKLHYPNIYEKYSSETISPMLMLARTLRKKYPDAKLVFIGPCVAKKYEFKLPKAQGYMDHVLSFEELYAMFKAKNIDPLEFECDGEYLHGSKEGRGYCFSGGVSSSILEYFAQKGEDASYIKPIAASGALECNECLKKLEKGQLEGNLLEGMMCMGGCTSGPVSLGAPPVFTKVANRKENIQIQATKIADVTTTLDVDGLQPTYEKKKDY